MSVFLGIDQTGAINSRGSPRPLPACLLDGDRFDFFELESFSPEVQTLINKQFCIVLDCVLGLPLGLSLSWREALHLLEGEFKYGREPAEFFFDRIGGGKVHYREVEILAKSNSLFRSRPYQKNIQTGTYRLWVEMAKSQNWFRAPWLTGEADREGVPLYEGYPTLLWRRLFNSPKRDPFRLKEWTEVRYRLKWKPEQRRRIEKDPNFADALVLALGGREILDATVPKTSCEGWILGVPTPENATFGTAL
jgi:hypothetical protein